ncbi:hypothetical protein ABFS83_03G024200 [Erythranthe nasuta]
MISLIRRNLTSSISNHSSLSLCNSQFFSTSRSENNQTAIAAAPTVLDILLHKHHFSPEVASLVDSDLRFSNLTDSVKADSVLSYFRDTGFSTSQLEKLVKYRPRFLASSVEKNIKPKIKIFQDLGFSSQDIAYIMTSYPTILHSSIDNSIVPSLTLLKGMLGSDHDLAKILRLCGWFLTADLEKNMVPNVEFLKSYGVPMERILVVIYSNPRCLLIKTEIMKKSVERIEKIGFDRSSKMFVYAIMVITMMSEETWERKLQGFRELGFPDTEILAMFRKAPMLFTKSTEKMKTIKELVFETGKFDNSSIVNNPVSLACSIENRYKPRFQVLGILESKNLIEKWPGLSTICKLPDDKFFERYIGPHLSELGGQVYVANSYWQKEKLKP